MCPERAGLRLEFPTLSISAPHFPPHAEAVDNTPCPPHAWTTSPHISPESLGPPAGVHRSSFPGQASFPASGALPPCSCLQGKGPPFQGSGAPSGIGTPGCANGPALCPYRLQSGMNLQICFVNDSGSDKDSDADDSKTETSLDTPLSPMVSLPLPCAQLGRSAGLPGVA